MYSIVSLKSGVAAVSPDILENLRKFLTDAQPGQYQYIHDRDSHTVLLPRSLGSDLCEAGQYIEFSTEIKLSEDDINNLSRNDSFSFSFTHYGPEQQDKPTNQDFALSGGFDDESKFAILADGISNGVAFAQRGAQLSCFAAYRCLEKLHSTMAERQGLALSETDVSKFRSELASTIKAYLHGDREYLLEVFGENSGKHPPNIAKSVWETKFRDHEDRWYGNTLIVSYAAPYGGLIVYAGDGGIIVMKSDERTTEVMRSDESSILQSYISSGVSELHLMGAVIEPDDTTDFLEIITVTDGVDRTYQINNLSLQDEFSQGRSLQTLVEKIANLKQHAPDGLDTDNFSIARIFVPMPNRAHTRLATAEQPRLPPHPESELQGQKGTAPAIPETGGGGQAPSEIKQNGNAGEKDLARTSPAEKEPGIKKKSISLSELLLSTGAALAIGFLAGNLLPPISPPANEATPPREATSEAPVVEPTSMSQMNAGDPDPLDSADGPTAAAAASGGQATTKLGQAPAARALESPPPTTPAAATDLGNQMTGTAATTEPTSGETGGTNRTEDNSSVEKLREEQPPAPPDGKSEGLEPTKKDR